VITSTWDTHTAVSTAVDQRQGDASDDIHLNIGTDSLHVKSHTKSTLKTNMKTDINFTASFLFLTNRMPKNSNETLAKVIGRIFCIFY